MHEYCVMCYCTEVGQMIIMMEGLLEEEVRTREVVRAIEEERDTIGIYDHLLPIMVVPVMNIGITEVLLQVIMGTTVEEMAAGDSIQRGKMIDSTAQA